MNAAETLANVYSLIRHGEDHIEPPPWLNTSEPSLLLDVWHVIEERNGLSASLDNAQADLHDLGFKRWDREGNKKPTNHRLIEEQLDGVEKALKGLPTPEVVTLRTIVGEVALALVGDHENPEWGSMARATAKLRRVVVDNLGLCGGNAAVTERTALVAATEAAAPHLSKKRATSSADNTLAAALASLTLPRAATPLTEGPDSAFPGECLVCGTPGGGFREGGACSCIHPKGDTHDYPLPRATVLRDEGADYVEVSIPGREEERGAPFVRIYLAHPGTASDVADGLNQLLAAAHYCYTALPCRPNDAIPGEHVWDGPNPGLGMRWCTRCDEVEPDPDHDPTTDTVPHADLLDSTRTARRDPQGCTFPLLVEEQRVCGEPILAQGVCHDHAVPCRQAPLASALFEGRTEHGGPFCGEPSAAGDCGAHSPLEMDR